MDSEEDEDQALVGDDQVEVVVVAVGEGPTVQGLSTLTHWLVTGVGCVAIWPVTAPNPGTIGHREVAMLALPEENSLNPGIKAHNVDVAMGGKSGSVP